MEYSFKDLLNLRRNTSSDSWDIFKNIYLTQREKNLELEELSIIDSLTNLYNRRKFDEILGNSFQQYLRELEKIKNNPKYEFRKESDLSLILLDIDNFKSLNDNYGHQEGDNVLKNLGSILKLQNGHLRNSDYKFRYGGEEFALILPETDYIGGYNVAEKLRKQIENYKFSEDYKITVSMGIASFGLFFPNSIDDFIKTADKRLYLAKNNGKNQVF